MAADRPSCSPKLSKVALAAATAVSLIGAIAVNAQTARPTRLDRPLVLRSFGSFFVGGHTIDQTVTELGGYGAGPLAVDQMYVQYMVPRGAKKPAIVLIHGGTLSGASYETTPDGRMGWYEYFVRKGYPSYVADQVGRGRSGFQFGRFNNVRSGVASPSTQPNLRRVANNVAWVRFRFGPRPGVAFDDTQFPVEAATEFAKQSVPDMSVFPTARDDPNFFALAQLAPRLSHTVIIGHSQSGQFPFETALISPVGIQALVAIEPAGCNSAGYSNEEIAKLAKLPILIVFGDHLDTPQEFGASWLSYFQDCEAFAARIRAAKGDVRLLRTSDVGIHGNSHMMMQDKNNLEIADLIIKWLGRP